MSLHHQMAVCGAPGSGHRVGVASENRGDLSRSARHSSRGGDVARDPVACPFRLDGAEVHFKGKVARLAANHAVVAFREVGDTTSTYHVDYDRMFHFVS